MLLKTCSVCGVIITQGQTRCNTCEKKRNKQRYERSLTNHEHLYKTARWTRVRSTMLRKYNFMCVYSWYKYQQVRTAKIIHHIELANRENFFDLDNLIPLEFDVHEKIHSDYSDEVKAELKEMQRMWMKDFIF